MIVRAFLTIVLVLFSRPAFADLEATHLKQLHHTVWTQKDGVPLDAFTLTQAGDGFLWLGSTNGLFRFDGVRFERFEPLTGALPEKSVYFLSTGIDGSLWVGWRFKGISRIREGSVTSYSSNDGIPEGAIWGFAHEADGVVWAAGLNGLARFDGKRWTRVGPSMGFTAHRAAAIFLDKDGTVGVFTEKGLFLKAKGAQRFAPPVGKTEVRQPPVQAKDGTIYLMDGQAGIRRIDSLFRHEEKNHPWIGRYGPKGNGSMLVDSSGALWFDDDDSLVRIPEPKSAGVSAGSSRAPSAQPIGYSDGLSGRVVYALYEDSGQNIWVLTDMGLDRFRRSTFAPLLHDPNRFTLASSGMVAAGNGLFLHKGNVGMGWVFVDADGKLTHLDARATYDAHAMSDGTVWRALAGRLIQYKDEREIRVLDVPEHMTRSGFINRFTFDQAGNAWISTSSSGIFHHNGKEWLAGPSALPGEGKTRASVMNTDTEGNIWIGYLDGKLARVSAAKKIDIFGPEEGALLDHVTTILESKGRLWVAGSGGVLYFNGGKFRRLESGDGGAIADTSSVVEAMDGSLWFNTTAGVLRVGYEQLRRLDSGRHVTYRTFSAIDGINGIPSVSHEHSAARDRAGRLWFATSAGVFYVDPRHIVEHGFGAPAQIVSARTGNKSYSRPATLRLGAGERNLQIDFTAANLANPDATQFRYRLIGYDEDWQDVGARRQAFYTGIPPGRYVFEAVAFGPGSQPAGPASSLPLEVEPQWYETIWFRLAALALVLSLLYGVYRWRLLLAERRALATAEVRISERERIARELHDTLLQGTQGLILQVQAIAMKLAPVDPLRLPLERIVFKANEVFAEGRDRVRELRSADSEITCLSTALDAKGAALANETGIAFELAAVGEHRPLNAACAYEIYRIAAEAMTNGFRHAKAKRVWVVLRFDSDALVVIVQDDGSGFESGIARDGKPGHFGITGMRERASRIGASLSIETANGTKVSLTLRGHLAYIRC